MHRHFRRLKAASGRRPNHPGVAMCIADFLRTDSLLQLRFGQIPARNGFGIAIRELAGDDAQLAHLPQTLDADRIPAGIVAALIAGNILRGRHERKMRRDERYVGKERPVGMLLRMLAQILDRMICNRGRRIIIVARLDRRGSFWSSLKVHTRIEVPVGVFQVVGAVEPRLDRPAIDMPLAGMIRAIAQWPETSVAAAPRRPDAAGLAGNPPGTCVQRRLLCEVARQQRGPRIGQQRAVL